MRVRVCVCACVLLRLSGILLGIKVGEPQERTA